MILTTVKNEMTIFIYRYQSNLILTPLYTNQFRRHLCVYHHEYSFNNCFVCGEVAN